MVQIFAKLPTLLIMGSLVVILFSMRRQHPSVQFRLWLNAWIVMFAHFCAQFIETASGRESYFLDLFATSSVLVSGVLFMASVSVALEVRWRRWVLISVSSAAVTLYSALMLLEKPHPALFLVALATALAVGVWHLCFAFKTWTWRAVSIGLLLAGTGMSARGILHGDSDTGYYVLMTLIYVFAGLVFYRRFRRLSIGVLASCGGFLLWGAVPAAFVWMQRMDWPVSGDHELWNVPKFIVAIGMVVTLLENQRIETDSSRACMRGVNEQLRRFADLTLQLLSGTEVATFGQQIAEAISEVSNYERAEIVLLDEERKLRIVGIVGVTDQERTSMEEAIAKNTIEEIEGICTAENRVGTNSFRSRTEDLKEFGAVLTRRTYSPNPFWREGDELLIPIRSYKGRMLGVISLDDPKDVTRVHAEDLSAIELLASDIGAAIETSDLQRRLMRSEKLAGIGQLVGGVAHELNNPLTAVLGYAEMLGERVEDPAIKRDLDVMRREALRMKRIIEDLQRFARQAPMMEFTPISLAAVIEESVKLRKLELHSVGVELSVNISQPPPTIRGDATMLKQALVNVVNNAIDAVRNAEVRRIRIEAAAKNGRAILRVSDSGPGFADISRVFDPFYTTKAPGKGTGLGLSICYAIVKDHEGEISAANVSPHGAAITINLPAASAGKHLVTPAG